MRTTQEKIHSIMYNNCGDGGEILPYNENPVDTISTNITILL